MDVLTVGQGYILQSNHIIGIVAIGGGLLVAMVAIMFGSIFAAVKTKAREETKRELAAYVAEGTMTPEDAERILKATPDDE